VDPAEPDVEEELGVAVLDLPEALPGGRASAYRNRIEFVAPVLPQVREALADPVAQVGRQGRAGGPVEAELAAGGVEVEYECPALELVGPGERAPALRRELAARAGLGAVGVAEELAGLRGRGALGDGPDAGGGELAARSGGPGGGLRLGRRGRDRLG